LKLRENITYIIQMIMLKHTNKDTLNLEVFAFSFLPNVFFHWLILYKPTIYHIIMLNVKSKKLLGYLYIYIYI